MVSGEIPDKDEKALMMEVGKDRIGVDPEEEKGREAAKAELAETEADIAKTELDIRKLEAAAKAPLTDNERSEYNQKAAAARAGFEKTTKDPDMVNMLVEAAKKNFMEEREGVKGRLERRKQEKEYLEGRKAELEQKLRGEQPS